VDSHKKFKRLFFIACCCLGLLIMVPLSIIDFLEGDRVELTVDAVIGLLLLVGISAVNIFKSELMVYRAIGGLICASLLYNLSIGAGEGTILYWLFIMPLFFFFFAEKEEGLIWSLAFIAVTCVLLFLPGLLATHAYPLDTGFKFLLAFVFVGANAYLLESSRFRFSRMLALKNEELSQEKRQLEEALNRIKTLKGLIPICASCKKIRDDKGYWNSLETYLSEHSDAQFSHGICPQCAEKLYPELGFREAGARKASH